MSSLNIQNQHISNLIDQITCPIEFTPLTNAVSLYPCNHNINLTYAEKIFTIKMENDPPRFKTKPCPICQKMVTSYSVDHTIQTIANLCFEIFDFDLKQVKQTNLKVEDPTTHIKKDPKKKEGRLTELMKHPLIENLKNDLSITLYPGKSGTFELLREFIHEESKNKLKKIYLDFRSTTSDSLLNRIGFENVLDSFDITLSFNYTDYPVRAYFKMKQINLEDAEEFKSYRMYRSRNPKSFKILLNIVLENNKFSKNELGYIQSFINK